jgi:hypothetical protein
MRSSPLSPITLGHNAFFGVDHLSAERGSERATHFADPRRVLEIVKAACEHGAQGMMMSTHERASAICEQIAADAQLRNALRIHPLLPYAQKYVTRANEVGMVNVVLEMLSGTSIKSKINLIWQGSKAAITRDVNGILSALMRIELKHFRDLDVGAVFLHDGFTDLALAFGMRDIFEFYVAEVPKICAGSGAFATKNLPLLLQRFKEWELPKPIVMTHFNKTGFHMNPDRKACEAAASAHDVSILAMGSLASGYLRPDEAYSYLAGIPHIDGVVVGVSRAPHIEETFNAIRRHLFPIAMRSQAGAS